MNSEEKVGRADREKLKKSETEITGVHKEAFERMYALQLIFYNL